MSLCYLSVAAYRVILVCNPYKYDHIESRAAVIEKFGHYSFHTLNEN